MAKSTLNQINIKWLIIFSGSLTEEGTSTLKVPFWLSKNRAIYKSVKLWQKIVAAYWILSGEMIHDKTWFYKKVYVDTSLVSSDLGKCGTCKDLRVKLKISLTFMISDARFESNWLMIKRSEVLFKWLNQKNCSEFLHNLWPWMKYVQFFHFSSKGQFLKIVARLNETHSPIWMEFY